jgi:glucose/arabinose dehydrogenase
MTSTPIGRAGGGAARRTCATVLCAVVVTSCSSGAERTEAVGSAASAPSDSCDGFPKLDVETPAGVCVGVAAGGFRKIRGIGELADGDLVVADMGSWTPGQGSIWRLHRNGGGGFDRRKLLDGVDRPASVAIGADGLAYVGTPSAIIRLDLASTAPVAEVVIAGLPNLPRPPDASENHSLKAIAFDPYDRDALYVTVGSGSNVCSDPDKRFPYPCPELEPGPEARAEVRRYAGDRASYEVVASGLRNPFAFTLHPESGLLLLADNGRDAIDALDPSLTPREADLPHEALDVIFVDRDRGERRAPSRDRHRRFGWPYCYDDRKNNPEYPQVDCRRFARPALLLPGHAAPLGMAFYTKQKFPRPYWGALLVTYHGYREHGHRVVLIPTNRWGEPRGTPLDVIRGWGATSTRPQGQPVAVFVSTDGAIFVTDDENGDLLRLSYDPSAGDGAPLPPLTE